MSLANSMTAAELRASLGLAAIFGLRMLGMFIILPVFALYAEQLPGGADHALIGVALGAYGLTQAVLQVPFGWLSDRWGRKRTIYLGLLLFAAGSFIAAAAQDIDMVILGRIIQGAGAISAAVIALTADLTRDEQRTQAMAIIGVTISVTFAASIAAGPILNQAVGVPGIFAMTGVLALAAMAVVRWLIPDPVRAVAPALGDHAPRFASVLRDPELARLNLGIFVLHALLMALFVVVPFELRSAGVSAPDQWQVYLPVMAGAFILMVPPLILAERWGWQKAVFLGSIAVLLTGQLGLMWLSQTGMGIGVSLLLFFLAFNLLEASLPSLVSRTAPPSAKGMAVGVYSSVQSLGAFMGAAVGGLISQRLGSAWIFGFCAAGTLLWLAVASGMRGPQPGSTRSYPVPPLDAKRAAGLSRKLADVPGVREVMLLAGEGMAYLKVDSARFDERSVLELIAGET
jgi:predicted MFS family arabinose efflux permease